MSMFDSIINQAEERYGLGGKAGTLLSALLALITDGTRGGFAGFLEKFNRAGLGDTASSWVNSGANTPLSNEQLESALGTGTLISFAAQAGTDYSSATSATAFMIPHVVDNLTPAGVVPPDSDLLSRIGDYLTGIGGTAEVAKAETFDRIGTAATTATPDANENVVADVLNTTNTGARSIGERADDSLNRVDTTNVGDNSPLKWMLPLLLLGLLLGLGYMFCSKSPEPVSPTNTNAKVNVNAANN